MASNPRLEALEAGPKAVREAPERFINLYKAYQERALRSTSKREGSKHAGKR